jgi:hypothetical protein
MQPVSKQRLGKQFPAETNTQATIEEVPFLCNGLVNTPHQQQRGYVFCVIRAEWL